MTEKDNGVTVDEMDGFRVGELVRRNDDDGEWKIVEILVEENGVENRHPFRLLPIPKVPPVERMTHYGTLPSDASGIASYVGAAQMIKLRIRTPPKADPSILRSLARQVIRGIGKNDELDVRIHLALRPPSGIIINGLDADALLNRAAETGDWSGAKGALKAASIVSSIDAVEDLRLEFIPDSVIESVTGVLHPDGSTSSEAFLRLLDREGDEHRSSGGSESRARLNCVLNAIAKLVDPIDGDRKGQA
jgi:hypothetical protein